MDDIPENKTPEAVTSILNSVLAFISFYGWTIVFIFVVANLLWSQFRPKWRQWRARRQQLQLDMEYHRNPDLLIAREEAVARSRQRLQEEHDVLSRQHAEKVKELEEKKRREKIEQWEKVQRVKLTNDTARQSQSGPSSGLRGSYNPLTGSGGGACYRPSRRGGNSGGG